jgi:hypothetical protein
MVAAERILLPEDQAGSLESLVGMISTYKSPSRQPSGWTSGTKETLQHPKQPGLFLQTLPHTGVCRPVDDNCHLCTQTTSPILPDQNFNENTYTHTHTHTHLTKLHTGKHTEPYISLKRHVSPNHLHSAMRAHADRHGLLRRRPSHRSILGKEFLVQVIQVVVKA